MSKNALRDRPLWVKSSLSVSNKYYHLSGWFRGIPDTRHSNLSAAINQKWPLGDFPFPRSREAAWLVTGLFPKYLNVLVTALREICGIKSCRQTVSSQSLNALSPQLPAKRYLTH
jgi:hypothetical protein